MTKALHDRARHRHPATAAGWGIHPIWTVQRPHQREKPSLLPWGRS